MHHLYDDTGREVPYAVVYLDAERGWVRELFPAPLVQSVTTGEVWWA